ncbi:ATP-binding protein [Halolamina salifodinae]|uniref:Replicative DNA helicase Mcm n=1 Tax=Halolamina salifodinae TaxID=1202767 RepID=A0A8T4GV48_9EURY|nr:minichromosome maintenance protein MCM [Halolamina salifodinae]MBP1986776.1 replicative DNA helicase Mcm [Halolamina salifodinae]
MTDDVWLSHNPDYPSDEVLYPDSGIISDAVANFEEYLDEGGRWFQIEEASGYKVVTLRLNTLRGIDEEFVDSLRQYPNKMLKSATVAFERFFDADCVLRLSEYSDGYAGRTIEGLSHRDLGTLVVLDGIVDSQTADRPRTAATMVVCDDDDCKWRSTLRQHWAIREIETTDECPSCGSSRLTHIDDIESASGGEEPLLIDSQRLTLVDIPENRDGDNEQGVLADLVGSDLVNEVDAGERVKVAGIVRIDQSEDMDRNIWIQAVGLQSEKDDFESVEVTEEDAQEIQEFEREQDDVIGQLSNAIAPSIADRDDIKEGAMLSLAGGVEKNVGGDSVRDDSHLLIVGDPSVGKSKILKSVAKIAPKSRYASGKGMSGVGVTATVEKVEHMEHKEWAVKRGTLSAATDGVAVLDELDKMGTDDLEALNEPLSDQQVSVDKASISTTLPADTTVIAGANPRDKRFDSYEPMGEQIQFEPDLVSRFDLVFAVRDTPGEHDEAIANHILSGAEEVATDGGDIIDQKFVQKYLAYARQNFAPKLTTDAKDALVEYWSGLREKGDETIVPIDSRKLQALQRLTEASARLNLRDEATVDDALRAIRLMSVSLSQTATDSKGNFDIDAVGGESRETRQRRQDVVQKVEQLTKETETPGAAVKLVVDEIEADDDTVESDIEYLREQGDLRDVEGVDGNRVIQA